MRAFRGEVPRNREDGIRRVISTTAIGSLVRGILYPTMSPLELQVGVYINMIDLGWKSCWHMQSGWVYRADKHEQPSYLPKNKGVNSAGLISTPGIVGVRALDYWNRLSGAIVTWHLSIYREWYRSCDDVMMLVIAEHENRIPLMVL